jgi:hypothetical protein
VRLWASGREGAAGAFCTSVLHEPSSCSSSPSTTPGQTMSRPLERDTVRLAAALALISEQMPPTITPDMIEVMRGHARHGADRAGPGEAKYNSP